jgi:hypothetical protein
VANPIGSQGNGYIGNRSPLLSDGLINSNTGVYAGAIPSTLYTWFGSSLQFDAITTKDAKTAYFVQGVGVYVGDTLYVESGSGGVPATNNTIVKVKTTDEIKTNTIVYDLDADLWNVIEPNSIYEFEFTLLTRCHADTDMNAKLFITTPALNDVSIYAMSTMAGLANSLQNTATTLNIAGTTGTTRIGILKGHIITRAGTGTFGISWTQATTGAGETTMAAGSILVMKKIA